MDDENILSWGRSLSDDTSADEIGAGAGSAVRGWLTCGACWAAMLSRVGSWGGRPYCAETGGVHDVVGVLHGQPALSTAART